MSNTLSENTRQLIAVSAIAAVGHGDVNSPVPVSEQVRQKVVEMTVAAMDATNPKSLVGAAITQIEQSRPFVAVVVGGRRDERNGRVQVKFRPEKPGQYADEDGCEELSTEPEYTPAGASMIALARELKGHRVLVFKEVESFTSADGKMKKSKVLRHLVDLGVPREGTH